MYKWNRFTRVILLASIISIIVFVSGCGDPNRENCKKACQKLVECDSTDNGGAGVLNAQWLANCELACEEADEIAEEVSDCIIKVQCDVLQQECGTGGT